MLVVAALFAPLVMAIVVLTGVSAAWSSVAGVLATSTLLALALQWLRTRAAALEWYVPISLLVVTIFSCATVSRWASAWLVWPVFTAALVAVGAGLSVVLAGVERSHAHAAAH